MPSKLNSILFVQKLLSEVLEFNISSIRVKMDRIPKDQFLNTPEETIIEHFGNLYIQPLQIYEDQIVLDESEAKVDVSHIRARNPFRESGPLYVNGIRVTITLPYTGDPDLWNLRPSSYRTVYPVGNVKSPNSEGIGYIDIVIEQPLDEDPNNIKSSINEQIAGINYFIDSQKNDINSYNKGIEDKILQAYKSRKERIKRHDGIVELLGIPLKRKEGIPEIRPIEVKKRLIKPLPQPPREGYKPEPGITEQDYEYILNIIRHEGKTFETTPKTYYIHDEEELRDIILAHLNGHFQGTATGETFRKTGKTDIRIEDDKRSAFVAECKIWNGEKKFIEGINQLLGYLTWRDCKSSIVIFNKHNSRFSELIETIPSSLVSHPNQIKDLGSPEPGEWRFIFSSLEDEARHILLHVFLFNIWVDKKSLPNE